MAEDSKKIEPDLIPPDLRRSMLEANMRPLWESTNTVDDVPEKANLWPAGKTIAIMERLAQVSSPEIVERRVSFLLNPNRRTEFDEAISGTITCSMQLVLPGEKARSHRHSMNALRFVVQGSGATIVNGKHCDMVAGDLVLTPGWCWHEHMADKGEPIIWIDVLDVPIHTLLRTSKFQPGPAKDLPAQSPDESFAVSGIVPISSAPTTPYSPLFRYSIESVDKALGKCAFDDNGSRIVRYTNPLTGTSVLPALDCSMLEVRNGGTTKRRTSAASSVCVVVSGSGTSEIGEQTINWSKGDVFTVPAGSRARHLATADAKVFMASNKPVYEALGLFYETLD